MIYEGVNGEYIAVTEITSENCFILKESRPNELSLLWFLSDDNQLNIDSVAYNFNKNDIVALTEFHRVEVMKVHKLKLLRFNRSFFCIIDHDSQVGCKGLLFYGAPELPILHPSDEELDFIGSTWSVMQREMRVGDNLQFEMLQMMLKRMLIHCTRIFRDQGNFKLLKNENIDIIREFNYLVEKHFKEKHAVNEYAGMLNRSPKTLSNLFGKLSNKSPLQFIQERLMMEARRLLVYSKHDISTIGYELGFNDVQSFSRFFKRMEGLSPLEFRRSFNKGKIANSPGIPV